MYESFCFRFNQPKARKKTHKRTKKKYKMKINNTVIVCQSEPLSWHHKQQHQKHVNVDSSLEFNSLTNGYVSLFCLHSIYITHAEYNAMHTTKTLK